MNTHRRALHSLILVATAALSGVGCSPANGAGYESFAKERGAYSTSRTTVGDWSNLPDNVQCYIGAFDFFRDQFGAPVPYAPETQIGDCAPEGACHLWLDGQPDPRVWERIEAGAEAPSTYDMIVYPANAYSVWGHVAMVDHVEDGAIYVMDDNYLGDERRSPSPHTVSGAPYGWYHLRSLPKGSGSIGGGSNGGNRDCAGLGDGLYCGGDYVLGDASTLYKCSGGSRSEVQVCGDGCQVMPSGVNDQCASGGGSNGGNSDCAGLYDGLYCGGDFVPGDASTLYKCSGGSKSVAEVCGKGCLVMPAGYSDSCN